MKENGDTLTKKGIKLMADLQKNKEAKKKKKEVQNEAQAEFKQAKRKSTDSQENVDQVNKNF